MSSKYLFRVRSALAVAPAVSLVGALFLSGCGDLKKAIGIRYYWYYAEGNDQDNADMMKVEFGGMNEVLYNLYAATGERKHADLAHRFDHLSVTWFCA